MSGISRKIRPTTPRQKIASLAQSLAQSPYLVLNEYHTLFKRNPTPESRHYGVQAFWDLKFTPRGALSPSTLRENIVKALQVHQEKYYLLEKIYAFGDISGFTKAERSEFYAVGIFLRHVQERDSYCPPCDYRLYPEDKYEEGVKTDLAETLVLRKMILHAYDIDPPDNILLITANHNFWPSIAELKDSGFKMMIATPNDASRVLMRMADVTWYWEAMRRGQRPRHSTKPSTEGRPIEQQFIALNLKLGVE